MSICKHGVNSNEAICGNCQNERHRKAGLKTRKMIAGISRFLSPIFGHWVSDGCICCGIHDAVTPRHTVWYNEGTGSSVLCEGCWHDLPTSEKVKYYKLAYERYWSNSDISWEEIEMAVRHPYYWRNNSGVTLEWVDEYQNAQQSVEPTGFTPEQRARVEKIVHEITESLE